MQIRLLLDANLSWRSVGVLKHHFNDCAHVDNSGLPIPAKDSESRKFIEQFLINAKNQIKAFIESSEYGILELL